MVCPRIRHQTMSPQVGKPLYIETPAGMVRISWDKSRRRRTLLIELPGCFVVHKGEDHAFSDLRFLRRDSNGKVHPNYQLLVPVVDADGEIMGIERPQALRLGRSSGDGKHAQ